MPGPLHASTPDETEQRSQPLLAIYDVVHPLLHLVQHHRRHHAVVEHRHEQLGGTLAVPHIAALVVGPQVQRSQLMPA